MPDENMEPVKLPLWYLKLEKVASKLAAGSIVGEIVLQLWQRLVPDMVFDIIHLVLIPFGIICIVFSGHNAIDILKKIKTDGK